MRLSVTISAKNFVMRPADLCAASWLKLEWLKATHVQDYSLDTLLGKVQNIYGLKRSLLEARLKHTPAQAVAENVGEVWLKR